MNAPRGGGQAQAIDADARMIRMLFYRGASGLLPLAAKMDRIDLVQWLLDHGVSPQDKDFRGRTALHFAKDKRMARALMGKGVPMDERDVRGQTPLHAAIAAGRLDVAMMLTRAGAQVDERTHRGLTPLHIAAAKGRMNAVAHLLRHGANPNALDRRGRHPLFYAVAGGHLDASKALMEGGADLEVLDERGTPWLHVARLDQVIPLQSFAQQAVKMAVEGTLPDFARVAFSRHVVQQGYSLTQ